MHTALLVNCAINIKTKSEYMEHNAKLKKVAAVQDDSGHWYVIPADMKEEFHQLLEKATDEDYDAQDAFNEKFSDYRTGGDLNLVQLYAEI